MGKPMRFDLQMERLKLRVKLMHWVKPRQIQRRWEILMLMGKLKRFH